MATGTEYIMRGLILISPQNNRTWGHRSQLTLWYGGLLNNHKRQSVNHKFQCPPSNLPFN